MEFRDWFCLKDRESFTIDAKINPSDARFYFGRAEIEARLKKQIRRAFVEPGVPKVLIYGSYGSGKTQTLFHLGHYLKDESPEFLKLKPKTVHVDLEMQSKSDHTYWHLQLVEALGRETACEWVNSLFTQVQNFDQEVEMLLGNHNLAASVKNLRGGGQIPPLAWRWLCGYRLTSGDLETLEVTRNLGDVGAGDMVNALVGLGRLAERNGEKLIFLMDEAEQFHNVGTGDATQSLHRYLRKLAEPSNSSVGFIIAAYSVTTDEMPEMMMRQDVRTRIGENNYVEIPPLPSIDDVRVFVQELLCELVEQKSAEQKIQTEGLRTSLETYPLTAEAFDALCEYASQDPAKSLPRNVIKCLNECAISAWDEQLPVIETEIVNEIAPLIFG